MPPSGHLVSDFNVSQLKERGFRREGIGQPASSLQAKVKKYRRMGRPRVMAAAPRLE